MKKLVKLLIATALIVTMAVCFAACGGKTMEKVYDLSGVKATAVATQLGYLSEFDGQEVYSKNGEWVVFYKHVDAYKTVDGNKQDDNENDSRTYTLYNAATGKVAATRTVKRGKVGFQVPYATRTVMGESFGVEISRVDNDTVIKTVYYGENSVNVGSVRENEIVYNNNAELAKIGDYIFKAVDGEISTVENATAGIGDLDAYMNGYYYDIGTNNYNGNRYNGVNVYDANLNLYGFVRVPAYAYPNVRVLSNGNVIIQYQVEQDPYGDDYDIIYVEEGEAMKINLTTMLYNVEKNTAKEIKFDYYVARVETENLAEKVDNIAYLYEINDGRIDDSEESVIVAKLSNNGKVGTIYGKAEDYLVNAEVKAIAENRFLAKSISGEKVLYNEEMEKLATFTGNAYVNEQYIVDGSKYYNFDGVLIVDATEYTNFINFASDGERQAFDNGNIVFRKYDEGNSMYEYFLLANGTFEKVATVWDGSVMNSKNSGELFNDFGDNYYAITKWTKDADTGVMTVIDYFYNMNGKEICKTESYEINENADRKPLVIEGHDVITEAEGVLVYKTTGYKYNENLKDSQGNVVGGYEYFTEYYCFK